jgi:hypothetical protein
MGSLTWTSAWRASNHRLWNPTAAPEMQQANLIYDERFVRPDRLVLNTLKAAFS